MAKTNGAVKNFDALGGSPLAVATTATVWTSSFLFEKNVTYSFEFEFSSAGVVEVDISLEQGNVAPATEGAISTDMVVPDGAGFVLENIGNTNRHIVSYTPVVSNFARLKIEGTGVNDAATVLDRMIVSTVVNQ